ncbi:MAG: 50S ribosomal protein L29 [Candidatus Wildermuthbacteria bacterium RIFCSPLOWO2_01_FULL_48_29]|uniref:Large ribosomal subunit protein uL29 n=2 Tax=Candidatus Wildermuthiibacteriota TaxID=1817923 RepID=A0A1G2RMT2_9BACT|nr:MAG: 50S ribosomal protein L29 [Candidatus Wildermuthbacteria bacterium RIFCSPHIGHO2_01_FULL_48_27b]OHA74175.1 MAG: 50S ribosomal protein L29 [Candidatus Wildermuthbacteria bacterium RIFCSPLOWO2_01_FULL_48_29]
METLDLQKKTVAELQKMLREQRAKLQQLRFDLPGGKVKNVRGIREIRRSIARILTLIRQKQ